MEEPEIELDYPARRTANDCREVFVVYRSCPGKKSSAICAFRTGSCGNAVAGKRLKKSPSTSQVTLQTQSSAGSKVDSAYEGFFGKMPLYPMIISKPAMLKSNDSDSLFLLHQPSLDDEADTPSNKDVRSEAWERHFPCKAASIWSSRCK